MCLRGCLNALRAALACCSLTAHSSSVVPSDTASHLSEGPDNPAYQPNRAPDPSRSLSPQPLLSDQSPARTLEGLSLDDSRRSLLGGSESSRSPEPIHVPTLPPAAGADGAAPPPGTAPRRPLPPPGTAPRRPLPPPLVPVAVAHPFGATDSPMAVPAAAAAAGGAPHDASELVVRPPRPVGAERLGALGGSLALPMPPAAPIVPTLSPISPLTSTAQLARDSTTLSSLDTETLQHVDKQHRQSAITVDDLPAPCVVCFAAARTILFLPCRHSVCCVACARQLARCPVCNDEFDDVDHGNFCESYMNEADTGSNPDSQ